MAFIVKNNLFYHVPKTGGIWLRKLIKSKYRKYYIALRDDADTHVSYEKTKFIQGVNRIAFVRHPFSWYKSYWAYRTKTKWNRRARFKLPGMWAFDKACGADDFNEFLTNSLKYSPSFYSDVISLFVGRNLEYADYIVKFENLYEETAQVLEKVGLDELTKEDLEKTKPQNASPAGLKSKADTEFSEELKTKIWEANKDLAYKLGYTQ